LNGGYFHAYALRLFHSDVNTITEILVEKLGLVALRRQQFLDNFTVHRVRPVDRYEARQVFDYPSGTGVFR
jgi:hypothetical protein